MSNTKSNKGKRTIGTVKLTYAMAYDAATPKLRQRKREAAAEWARINGQIADIEMSGTRAPASLCARLARADAREAAVDYLIEHGACSDAGCMAEDSVCGHGKEAAAA